MHLGAGRQGDTNVGGGCGLANDLLLGADAPGGGPEVPALTLITLGGARLVGVALTSSERGLLEVGKPLALIAFVCASPGRQARRELLLDLLWADLEPDAAKHALRQTLWYIKKRVGERAISATSDVVTVSESVSFDRDALLAASDASDHARVVGLYSGEFLPNFATPGGAEFEKWAEIERRRLRLIFLRSAEARVHELLGRGRPRDALGIARQARDADPISQAGWRLVLEVLSAGRDWTQARMEADAFEQFLAREELEFEPASRAQLRVARAGDQGKNDAEPVSPSPSAELVGREREFALLLEGVESAQRGRGRHVHLRASAGIGKTRLLLDLHARLRGARTRSALVRCDMGSREIPFAAASEIALALGVLPGARGISPDSASALVAMAPSLSGWFSVPNDMSAGEEALRRRSHALAELASAVSDEQALVLLVDDVHWMDSGSRTILGQVAARVSAQHVLVVTAGRPAAEGRVDSGQAQVIELHPLTEAQCGELLASIASTGSPSIPRRFVPELWRATLGSPLHVLEMVQLLRERNLLWTEDGEWRSSAGDQLMQVLREGGALQRRLMALPREERHLLVLLAVAGAPTPAEMLEEAGGGGVERTADWLHDLEQRGLVERSGNDWTLAHDEVGEVAFECTDPDSVRSAHAAVGRWLWQRSAGDARAMRRAAQHLAQGGETAPLHALFHRFVTLLRSLGDSRPLHTLADDMLGRHASAEFARGLVKSLPLHVRAGLTSPRRVALFATMSLAVMAIVASAVVSTIRQTRRTPDVEILAMVSDSAGTLRQIGVPVHGEDFAAGESVIVDGQASPKWRMPIEPAWSGAAIRPGGRSFLTTLIVADSGTNDLFLLDPDGRRERVTFAPGDDEGPSWSPDGRFVAFTTARWQRADSHYDLAVLDRETGNVRQLTSGDATDVQPMWSPRGHRIAFLRRHWDGSPNSVCTVGFDGGDSSCVAPRDGAVHVVLAWSDDETLLTLLEEEGERSLAYLRLADGRRDVLQRVTPAANGAMASSDGRWVLCRCARVGYEPSTWFLVPTDRPALMLPLRLTGLGAKEVVHLQFAPGDARRMVDSTEVVAGGGGVRAGLPHQLLLRARTRGGETLQLGPARWSVVDTTQATIDPASGILLARRPGRIAVNVSLAGWRPTRTELEVKAADTTTVFAERWENGIGRRWTAFGAPLPSIAHEGGAPRFLNNGDGRYSSGVFTTATVDATQGLVVESSFSTPVTRPQWQRVDVTLGGEFVSPPSVTELAQGALPPGSMTARCSFSYPGGSEGPTHADSIAASSSTSMVRILAAPALRTGAWQELALGLLPDGRCFTILNDELLWLSTQPVEFAGKARLFLSGSSDSTRMLMGSVRVTRGIPQRILDRLVPAVPAVPVGPQAPVAGAPAGRPGAIGGR